MALASSRAAEGSFSATKISHRLLIVGTPFLVLGNSLDGKHYALQSFNLLAACEDFLDGKTYEFLGIGVAGGQQGRDDATAFFRKLPAVGSSDF
jgi:hypothetical protein